MDIIDAVLVRTIKELSLRLDDDGIRAEGRDLARAQPHLLALLHDQLETHGQRVDELGARLLAIVWRMFESGAEEPLVRIERSVARAIFEQTLGLLYALDGANSRFVERVLDARYSRQPHIMAYVESQCAGGPNSSSSELSNGELGALFAALRAAVDTMHLAGAPTMASRAVRTRHIDLA